jgi:hypothetical protein
VAAGERALAVAANDAVATSEVAATADDDEFADDDTSAGTEAKALNVATGDTALAVAPNEGDAIELSDICTVEEEAAAELNEAHALSVAAELAVASRDADAFALALLSALDENNWVALGREVDDCASVACICASSASTIARRKTTEIP